MNSMALLDSLHDNTRIPKLLAFSILAWPYAIMGSLASSLFLLANLVISFLFLYPKYGFIISKAIVLFISFAFFYITIAYIYGGDNDIFVSQSNHFFQFFIYNLLFINLLKHFDFCSLASKNNIIILFAVVLVIYFYKTLVLGQGGYSAIDLNYYALLLLLLCYTKKISFKKKYALVFLVLIFTFLLSLRTSFIFIGFAFSFFCFFSINRSLATKLSIILIATPIILSFFVTWNDLKFVYDFDPNTAIRLEFIKSAVSNLSDDLLTSLLGVGFGEPYRNIYFDYYNNHGLLMDEEKALIISNHNSILDTYYRLGIFPTLVFLYSIYFSFLKKSLFNKLKTDSTESFLIISIGIGLSVDAWFENQLQLPLFAFLVSLLMIVRRNTSLSQQENSHEV